MSALKFLGFKLKQNIPYTVFTGQEKKIPRVVVVSEFLKCHLALRGPPPSPPFFRGGLSERLL